VPHYTSTPPPTHLCPSSLQPSTPQLPSAFLWSSNPLRLSTALSGPLRPLRPLPLSLLCSSTALCPSTTLYGPLCPVWPSTPLRPPTPSLRLKVQSLRPSVPSTAQGPHYGHLCPLRRSVPSTALRLLYVLLPLYVL
jgi:hypothetical protein